MGRWPTPGNESPCHPDPERSEGEGSAVPVRGELMQILRGAQYDSGFLWFPGARQRASMGNCSQKGEQSTIVRW
jgi:hypothetical protein